MVPRATVATAETWRMDTPLVHDGSTERIAAFLAGLCAVHAEAYETTVEDAAALVAYGLDEPLRLICCVL